MTLVVCAQSVQADRDRVSSGKEGVSMSSGTGRGRGGRVAGDSGSTSGGGATAGGVAGVPVAVQFRGKSMESAKHTGRWVIFHKVHGMGCRSR